MESAVKEPWARCEWGRAFATRAGSAILLPEPLHFSESLPTGPAARAQLAVAAHECVVSQHCRQRDGEHLTLLVEAANMLRGLQLTTLKQLDLAARDGQRVFAHVRLLLFESSRGPRASKIWQAPFRRDLLVGAPRSRLRQAGLVSS